MSATEVLEHKLMFVGEIGFGKNTKSRFATGDGLPQIRVSIAAREVAPDNAQVILRHRPIVWEILLGEKAQGRFITPNSLP